MLSKNIPSLLLFVYLILLCGCTTKPSKPLPPQPIDLGEITIEDLMPCAPLVADKGPWASDVLIARPTNDGAHVTCQDRNTGLAGIAWEAIRRGVLRLVGNPDAHATSLARPFGTDHGLVPAKDGVQ